MLRKCLTCLYKRKRHQTKKLKGNSHSSATNTQEWYDQDQNIVILPSSSNSLRPDVPTEACAKLPIKQTPSNTYVSHSKTNINNLARPENTISVLHDEEFHLKILDEVAEFNQRFSYPQTDVRILISKNVIVYLLGTNHANSQCRSDVVDVIEKIRPQSVLVELCPLRACGCQKHYDNAFQITPKFTFKYLRNTITQLGFLPAIIFFTDVFREQLISECSLFHYGGEFIAAITAAQSQNNCRIVLADRPIEITVKRQASAMGNWRGLKVTIQVTLALILRKRMKQLMINANRLVFDDPKTYEVLVFERDLYLTYSIQKTAQLYQEQAGVKRIVAVIGQGHMQGIQTYWGKVPSEFIPFITSPHTLLDQ